MNDINQDIKLLKEKCSNASKEEAKELWSRLKEVLEKHPEGIGLSAIQLNPPVYKNVAVVRIWPTKIYYYLLNSKIVKTDDPFMYQGEGCLSLPGVYKTTMRYKHIVLEDDNLGKVCFNLHMDPGPVVVAIQHEIDHMNGILILDRIQKPFVRKEKKIGRNDPCPCGSGKKYKKCCGGK